jgi:hypothetical protein
VDKAIIDLGANLAALARSEDDLDCLEVFAKLVESGTQVPSLLSVIVAPDGARIITIGNPNPGLTLQVKSDHTFALPQLAFGEAGDRPA